MAGPTKVPSPPRNDHLFSLIPMEGRSFVGLIPSPFFSTIYFLVKTASVFSGF